MKRANGAKSRSLSLREIFLWPGIIGLVTAVGLVAALLGTGAWDAVSWAALAVPILTALWAFTYRRR
jgi:hypothetical protein